MTKVGEIAKAASGKIQSLTAQLEQIATSAQLLTSKVNEVVSALALARQKQAAAEAELKKTKEMLANLQMEGDFSAPMTKKQMAGILNLKPRAFNTFAKSHGLRPCGRQLFQIRLNAMDKKTHRLFE